ncbi:MAG: isocitrate/isopropylmalate family dehydrogenase [Acidimicrobiia bacterium]|nr:isocitrate/isopropylmalate family dehydrogenase [Acidimicrobiia bacterium]
MSDRTANPAGPKTVAVAPGDDAAPEAVASSMDVLLAMDLPVTFDVLPTGTELAAELAPAEREAFMVERLDAADTVLFGSSNGTTPGIAHLRWGRGTYANVRPVEWRPGYRSPMAHPEHLDYVIVRENLEDAYVGIMGDVDDLRSSGLIGPRARLAWSGEGRYAAKIITREGTEKVARFSYELARKRGEAKGKAPRLTVSAKTNMLPATDRWFCSIVEEVGANYPDVALEQYIVDDMAHRLVTRPDELDVLLLPNLYGDVLSDLGAGTIGGMGLAPSGCYGDDAAYFESAHGTAPDIAGQDRINPTATLLSAAMMLEWLGLDDRAQRLDRAIGEVYAEGRHLTLDQGGTATTAEFSAAVVDRL